MDTAPEKRARDRGHVIVLIKDLFFSVAVRNAVRALGFESHVVKSADACEASVSVFEPALAIVDLNAIEDPSDWDLIRAVQDRGVPVLVFGPHRDVEGMRAAKAAGVTRVVSNGQFHAEMASLIERYARPRRTQRPLVPDGDDEALTMGSVPPGMTDPICQPGAGEFATRG